MENIVIILVKLAGTSPQEKEEEDVAPDSNILISNQTGQNPCQFRDQDGL